MQSALGAPGPENLRSPTLRNRYLPATLVDPLRSASEAPNRERNSLDTGVNKTYGTLAIRRSYRNYTNLPVTRLRWRIINITALHSPGYSDPAQADVRALSSTNVLVTRYDGSQVEVQGTTLEAPTQAKGGGLNATLALGTITLGSPLAAGSSVQVQFLLGVERLGNFSFYVNVEAVTATEQPVVGPPVPADGFPTEPTATSTKLVFDEGTNRITTEGFKYDAAGNQTQIVRADGTIQRLRYDAAGRLVKVQNQQGVTLETTTYGADSQRLIVQAGDENSSYRTYYAWSGQAVIAEYNEGYTSTTTPQWTKSYVYLGARLLLTLEPGSTSDYIEYHHPDRLGTRLVSNNANLSVIEQTTLPYGVPLDAESNGATNRRFTSYERSAATGLDYAINRHYDAVQGRFTQVDPIGMEAVSLDDPQSLNLYAYCGNDPINSVDPDGLFSFKKLFSGIGKVFKIAAKILAVALVVAIAVTITAYTLGASSAFGAFMLNSIIKPLGIALAAASPGYAASSIAGIGRGPFGGTPPFNPNAGTAVGGLSNFISGWQDGDDVIRVTTSCKNSWPASDGANCPGAPWYRRLGDWLWENKYEIALEVGITFIPPARVAGLLFRAGRWGYRGIQAVRAARRARASGGRVVIGKMADLRRPGALRYGERELDLPDLGSPRANWEQNSSRLREAMRIGHPIRDASINPATGALRDNTGFLRAERNLLSNHGWQYNTNTGMWYPPGR